MTKREAKKIAYNKAARIIRRAIESETFLYREDGTRFNYSIIEAKKIKTGMNEIFDSLVRRSTSDIIPRGTREVS